MQTKLEKNGIATRKETLVKNEYIETSDQSQEYKFGSKKEQSPIGKGTMDGGPDHIKGHQIDVENGGSSADMNGVSSLPYSGRKANLGINSFNDENQYSYGDNAIDTTLNVGQIDPGF